MHQLFSKLAPKVKKLFSFRFARKFLYKKRNLKIMKQVSNGWTLMLKLSTFF